MDEVIDGRQHVFYSPNKVVFGPETARTLLSEIQKRNRKRPLIVTDPGITRTDFFGLLKEDLKTAGTPYSIYDQVEPEPGARLVAAGTEQLKSEECDIVIGIGGGSSLDVAKGVSIMATNAGRVLDMSGIDMVKRKGAPMILMPTTAGTGSEVSNVTVLTDEETNTKKVVYSFYMLPDVAIVDPLLTLTMPAKLTAETGIDALVHAIEAYVSMNASPFSDLLAERAIRLIAKYLPVAWAKGSNIEARHFTSLAASLAGMAFCSGGLGGVHALAYPLGTEYHMAHGRSNAVMLPHVMRYNVPGNPNRYAQIAAFMGKSVGGVHPVEAATLAVKAVEELLETLQVSYRLRDYGITEKDIPKLVNGGMKQSRLFGFNPRDLEEEDVKLIYQQAY